MNVGEMTWRARFYLTVAGLRHALTGLAAMFYTEFLQFPNVEFGVPLYWWGVVFLIGGAHLLYAAKSGSETQARVALAISAVMTSVWAAAFIAWFFDDGGTPLAAILFTALTLKDLTVVRDPMRSPFETIVKEYTERDRE